MALPSIEVADPEAGRVSLKATNSASVNVLVRSNVASGNTGGNIVEMQREETQIVNVQTSGMAIEVGNTGHPEQDPVEHCALEPTSIETACKQAASSSVVQLQPTFKVKSFVEAATGRLPKR